MEFEFDGAGKKAAVLVENQLQARGGELTEEVWQTSPTSKESEIAATDSLHVTEMELGAKNKAAAEEYEAMKKEEYEARKKSAEDMWKTWLVVRQAFPKYHIRVILLHVKVGSEVSFH